MTDYKTMIAQAEGILEAEPWYVAALSNLSALVKDTLPALNWAGFYFVGDGGLTVGPFQGKPACIRIAAGKGVCGTAVSRNETVVVPDVHLFPGHIACDSASRSELVIPLHADGKAVAVLDMDSPTLSRFTTADEAALKKATEIMENLLNWDGI